LTPPHVLTPWWSFALAWATPCMKVRPWPTSTAVMYQTGRFARPWFAGPSGPSIRIPCWLSGCWPTLLRALSPAVNDPATAVDAIDATEGVLRSLATRELDVADVTDDAGHTRVRLLLPTWEDYLRIAVEDLLPAAAPFRMVLQCLRRLLVGLLDAPGTPRLTLLRLNSAVEDGLR
jgi:hypothetical protein